MTNVLFINFKNYPQAFENFPEIYTALERVAWRYPKVQTIFAPPSLLLAKVSEAVTVPLWAQHLDPLPLGRGTGFLPIEGGKSLGVKGTFLNHSEHRLTEEEVAKTVKMAESVFLSTLIFADGLEAITKAKTLVPDYIAYEPPELIGAGVERGISVATAKPEVIAAAAEAAKPISLIVGAGIFRADDIRVSLELGATGVAVSSALVTAPDPPAVLEELLSAFG